MGKMTRRNAWGLMIGSLVAVLAIGAYAIAHNPDLIPGLPPINQEPAKSVSEGGSVSTPGTAGAPGTIQ